jgi:hypothetical protein
MKRIGIERPRPTGTALSMCIEQEFAEGFDMLQDGGYLSKVSDYQNSHRLSLEAACKVGNIDLVERFLSLRKPAEVNYGPAIESGQAKVVEYLLSQAVCPDHQSLLMAVKHKQEHSPICFYIFLHLIGQNTVIATRSFLRPFGGVMSASSGT